MPFDALILRLCAMKRFAFALSSSRWGVLHGGILSVFQFDNLTSQVHRGEELRKFPINAFDNLWTA